MTPRAGDGVTPKPHVAVTDGPSDLAEMSTLPLIPLTVEIEEALAFTRSHKCRCCGTWRTNCMCWASFSMSGTTSVANACTPKDHGRDGYGW